MYKIVTHKYPNNEIRSVWASLPHPKSPAADPPPPIEESSSDLLPGTQEVGKENYPPPLSLGLNSKTQRSDAGFGRLPDKKSHFGLNAKRSLIRRGAAMENTAPPEECVFITGTLPGSTESAFRALAEWASYIVHRLKAWIATYAAQKLDFYCWEYQKRGALHLHYCVWMPNSSHRAMVLDKFHAWWIEVLHRVGEFTNVDMFRKNSQKTHLGDTSKVRAVAEICRKSPARYLAKYLSKSATPARGNSRAFSPARWWGTSRPLKSLCDSLTEKIEVIVGGYHAVRKLWEEINHVHTSSDSVTYEYRHKVGAGHTLVSYPSTPQESKCLLYQIGAFSRMTVSSFTASSDRLFRELKTLRMEQERFYSQLLENLPGKEIGLKNSLIAHLNWMQMRTESTLTSPLPRLLAWMARTAELRYILKSCQTVPYKTSQILDRWLDMMNIATNTLADLEIEKRLEETKLKSLSN